MSATVFGERFSLSLATQHLQSVAVSATAARRRGAGRNSWSSTKSRVRISFTRRSDKGSPVSHLTRRGIVVVTDGLVADAAANTVVSACPATAEVDAWVVARWASEPGDGRLSQPSR